MTDRAPESSSVLRFDLAIQRNHLLVYTLGLITGLAGAALGVFPLDLQWAFFGWAAACVSATVFYFLFRRGINRRHLNPIWLTVNIFLVTLGIYASGGVNSPWFIWYLASVCVAAFASGKAAAYLVGIGNTVAYIGTLLLMGQVAFWDAPMLLAITRMLFIFGASYFFLIGVANLQEKRLRIRQLESEATRRVEELTRLTQELADANRRTREADRLKSQFLANMSHELRTPMNSIIGFSEILVERLHDTVEPKHLGFLRHIHASGQHLLGIINDILDLSKIEAGRMEVYPEFFSIAPVVENVCQVMRGMAKATPKFVVDMPADLPQIETDLAKFKQVLYNLLSNAVKFSPPGTPVTIRARFEDGVIAVAVRDEGIGIDAMHHSVIFEEFRQVDGTARREFGGTGLGLALVKRFVELQGGHIGLESTPGAGSTFSFTLPVRSRVAVVTRPQPEVDAARAPADRVLVVEDDANAYDLIAAALGSAGYLSVRARHGEEALKIARETRPVAVTLDLVLPGVDGWEVLKRLKTDTETRQIPVVIISMVDNRDLGIALGADDYFVKPVDRDRLLERVRSITARTESGAKQRLLLIDDDPAIHTLLDEELSELGYIVGCAYSGEEGLRAAIESMPDVIILDLMMPGLTGFDVAESLKDDPRTANIPILVLTSKEISAEERQLLHAKVSSFVQKGNSARDHLLREIRRVTTSGVGGSQAPLFLRRRQPPPEATCAAENESGDFVTALQTLRVIAAISLATSSSGDFAPLVKITITTRPSMIATSFMTPGPVPVLCATTASDGTPALMRSGPVVVFVIQPSSFSRLVRDSPSRPSAIATSSDSMPSGVEVSRASRVKRSTSRASAPSSRSVRSTRTPPIASSARRRFTAIGLTRRSSASLAVLSLTRTI